MSTQRRTERRPQSSAGPRGKPDWTAIRCNLVHLHAHTFDEEHETVHLLARDMGFDPEWLHDAVREQTRKKIRVVD